MIHDAVLTSSVAILATTLWSYKVVLEGQLWFSSFVCDRIQQLWITYLLLREANLRHKGSALLCVAVTGMPGLSLYAAFSYLRHGSFPSNREVAYEMSQNLMREGTLALFACITSGALVAYMQH